MAVGAFYYGPREVDVPGVLGSSWKILGATTSTEGSQLATTLFAAGAGAMAVGGIAALKRPSLMQIGVNETSTLSLPPLHAIELSVLPRLLRQEDGRREFVEAAEQQLRAELGLLKILHSDNQRSHLVRGFSDMATQLKDGSFINQLAHDLATEE